MDSFLHRTTRKPIVRRVALATVSQMVIEALKILKHPNGSTLQKISQYVSNMCDEENDAAVREKVPLALERGVQFGAIKQNGAYYKLDAIMVMATKAVRGAETGRVSKNDTGKAAMKQKRRRAMANLQ